MSKLEKGYGSTGIQAILGDIKTYFEGKLAQKANTSDLGTAASRNTTNQITEGSTALPEAGAVKTALDSKISKSNTPGHVMNDGTIDTNTYAKEYEIEGLEADKLDVENVATSVNGTSSHSPKPFAVDDLLTFGGKLYRVIEAIALDDPIVFSGASANVTETSIEAEMANIGGVLAPLNVTLGEAYTIDDPSEIEAIIVSCIYDNNGSKFIMPAAYLNMDKISIGDTYFFEYDMDNTNIRASIGCSFYLNNSGKLIIYINDLSGYTTASVGCFRKNNTYTALVADEIDNILDTNY